MKDKFDDDLNLLRSRVPPACPAGFEVNVLRQIRLEGEVERRTDWLIWLSGLISKTSFAVPAFVAVVLISSLTTLSTTRAITVDRQVELSRAFGFDAINTAAVFDFELR